MKTVTFTESEKCAHENGWFITITCLFGMMKRRIFVCSDCGDWKDVK